MDRPAALATAASVLLGERWQEPLARGLGVSGRTVRRWAAGDRPVPQWVWERLIKELGAQRVVLRGAIRAARAGLRGPS